ncbi:G8 domain-containing protein [Allorhodopirellula heiligendammensis]|uniref:G8 domain protein n=1 Tax=Allorhodopirellula heiligendammensis TaxID=2714739 RepID=A0A5C6C3J1_9BACT|nr:G8 domain-containing protein [Allorhodopirellula heiligendammensis]TWU18086.1 G8 domain protein [Allorhodopirellula heiligendammensis]
MTLSRPRRLTHQLLESRRLLAGLAEEMPTMSTALASGAQPVAAVVGAESPSFNDITPVSFQQAEMDHSSDMLMPHTSQSLLDLVPLQDADAVALQSGDWSNSAIWQDGQKPAAGDKVLIAEGIHVAFDAQLTLPLHWIRVDGQLSWRTDMDTTMMVETLAVTGTGELQIGTVTQPIQPDVTAEILIDTTGGVIDQATDPTLLGRGLISHGSTEIHGAVKTSRAVSQADIAAGQTQLVLADAVTGWRVGDQLLIPGTSTDRTLQVNQYDQADAVNARFHDDVVTIAAIDGNLVTLESGTAWEHVRPVGDTFTVDELSLYVINLTRNIVIRSSDATVPNQQRGHVMIMHNPNADIAYAQFKDLGRSDKREIVDDPVVNVDGSPGNGDNPRGRYGLHLHMIGATSYNGTKAELTGNVVWGTPGWGIVQHDSYAVLRDNVVFDVVGAGIVSENGNEIGEWIGNTVVKITGDLKNNFDDEAFLNGQRGPRFDLGFTGSGYWVQGGGFGLLMQDNVAASINGAGFDLVHHTDGLQHVETLPVSLIYDPAVRQRYIDAGITTFTPNNVPMRGMVGVEVYNAYRGIHTWLHNRDSDDQEGAFTFGLRTAHDIKSVISDYTIWGVVNGVHNFYSSLMRYEDGLVIGNIDSPVAFQRSTQGNNSKGVGVSHNEGDSNRIDFHGLRVEGFQYGFQTFIPHNDSSNNLNRLSISSIDQATFSHVSKAFVASTKGTGTPFSELFDIGQINTIGVAGLAATPTFSDTSRGGLSMDFHADVGAEYVGYAWDFDNDGQFDDGIGADITHTYLSPGTYTVGLQVWDSSARTATTTRTISVSEQPTGNVLIDPNFTGPANSKTTRDDGWTARDFLIQNNTAVIDPANGWGQGVIYQIITDSNRLTGAVDFQFDYRRISSEGGAKMMVSVFGVDDYFGIEQYKIDRTPIRSEGIIEAPHYRQLVHANMASTSQGQWESVEFNVDVEQGFKYYFVRFAFDRHRVHNGDTVGVRNVALAGAAPMIVPALADQGVRPAFAIAAAKEDFSEPQQLTMVARTLGEGDITLPVNTGSSERTTEVDAIHTEPGALDDERRRLDQSMLDELLGELEQDGV